MNEYKFEDLEIGLKESFEYKVTGEAMGMFRALTGDTNPLHVDANFAKEHGFIDKVTYGMLTASLMSTLGGVYLPGKYCVIHGVETKFTAPVYENDNLTIAGEVKDLHDSVKQAEIKVTITNQDNKKVMKGSLKVGFLE